MNLTNARSPDSPETSPVPPASHVLVVDEKPEVREFLQGVLGMGGYDVTLAADAAEAREAATRRAPQVLLTDLQLGRDSGGQDLIAEVRAEHPTAVAIVLTGYGTVERTVELMRAGAFDVLTKPCRSTEILATVEKAVEHHRALWNNEDLRQRLQVQDKLAMIGKLAAGVAHELNNPLDATLRCVRLTQTRLAGDVEAAEYLDLAHAGLLRMADIVQGLLTFSRNATVEQSPQDLASVLREAVQAVELALGDAAPRFEQLVDGDVAGVPVPRGLHQVLTNLLRNAADAAARARPIEVRARRGGEDLVLEIRDDGPGIPGDVLGRVFEPFFTTKEPGRGTGLGLPISARLVERFGGSLRLDCPTDGGTVATVRLPLARRTNQGV
jgi:C4-dicarboxylate-specific signal transduction histidine kinase